MLCVLIEDCAKDGGEEFLPRYVAFELQIVTDSIGIRLKNTVHLGKNSLPPSLAQSSILQSNRKFYHIYTVTTVIHKLLNLIGTQGIAEFGPK